MMLLSTSSLTFPFGVLVPRSTKRFRSAGNLLQGAAAAIADDRDLQVLSQTHNVLRVIPQRSR